jgi:hypothetical protein
MTVRAIIILLAMLLAAPAWGGAVSEEDFKVKTTQNLVNLLTVSADDPLYHQAIHFSQGYMLGAYHYYEASVSGPKGVKLVCPPPSPPCRNEVIKMFIDWIKEHPQYLKESPVETEFRFLTQLWPCKP